MTQRWSVSADATRQYVIAVAEPLLAHDSDELLCCGAVPGRRLIVMDDGVPSHWRARFTTYFNNFGVDTEFLIVAGGERCKEANVVLEILEGFRRFGLDRRREPVVLVGGGAVLDAAGFAASVYRRGVPFLRVPTTLLGYVDAAIGIKNSINFHQSKNLVGTFTPPELVLLEREFFDSLPDREFASGLGEILKLGLGCDITIFNMLEEYAESIWTDRFRDERGLALLHRSIEVMLEQLGANIYESELCRPVDLGHTFSLAFEMRDGHPALRHGEAVALDLNMSAVLAARRGILPADDLRRLANLTMRLGLPTTVPATEPRKVWGSLVERTMHRGGRQRTPLPTKIGECIFVNDLTEAEVTDAFEEFSSGHFLSRRTLIVE